MRQVRGARVEARGKVLAKLAPLFDKGMRGSALPPSYLAPRTSSLPFAMELRDAMHGERIENVTSFVGEDASGSFGLLAHHARFMTVLLFGLARFRIGADDWRYLALPGGLLYFTANTLHLSTRRYFVGEDYQTISAQLDAQLIAEEERMSSTKENLRHMEEELLRSLWRMRQP